jgi:hypothetical protein
MTLKHSYSPGVITTHNNPMGILPLYVKCSWKVACKSSNVKGYQGTHHPTKNPFMKQCQDIINLEEVGIKF